MMKAEACLPSFTGQALPMKRALLIILFCVPFAVIGLLIESQNEQLFIAYVVVVLVALEVVARWRHRTRDNDSKTGMEIGLWLPRALPTLTGFPGIGNGLKLSSTLSAARFAGRAVPVVGYAILAYDAAKIAQCVASDD